MIEKIENPLNLELKQVDVLISELQTKFNEFSDRLGPFSLDESGVAMEIKTMSGTHSYDLAQLKLLKAELLDPVMNSLKEVS